MSRNRLTAEQVTHETVIRPHSDRTREPIRGHQGAVLLLSETTELDHTDHDAVAAEPGRLNHRARIGISNI